MLEISCNGSSLLAFLQKVGDNLIKWGLCEFTLTGVTSLSTEFLLSDVMLDLIITRYGPLISFISTGNGNEIITTPRIDK